MHEIECSWMIRSETPLSLQGKNTTTEKYRAKIHASRNRRVRTISSESVFLAEPRQHHHPQGMVRASEKKSAKIGRSPLASVTYS